VALNYTLVAKNDFVNAREFFEAILKSEDRSAKCLLLVLVFHFRDVQNGKGLRNPFFECLKLLLSMPQYESFVFEAVPLIAKYGYFKDLCRLWQEAKDLKNDTLCLHTCRFFAQQILKEASGERISNAAKFAPREGKKYKMMIQEIAVHMFGDDCKTLLHEYRKKLGEATAHYKQITEQLMSQKRWCDIDPKYVPSLCF
jgi:endonuclease IV